VQPCLRHDVRAGPLPALAAHRAGRQAGRSAAHRRLVDRAAAVPAAGPAHGVGHRHPAARRGQDADRGPQCGDGEGGARHRAARPAPARLARYDTRAAAGRLVDVGTQPRWRTARPRCTARRSPSSCSGPTGRPRGCSRASTSRRSGRRPGSATPPSWTTHRCRAASRRHDPPDLGRRPVRSQWEGHPGHRRQPRSGAGDGARLRRRRSRRRDRQPEARRLRGPGRLPIAGAPAHGADEQGFVPVARAVHRPSRHAAIVGLHRGAGTAFCESVSPF
jgi:hypothetical protein